MKRYRNIIAAAAAVFLICIGLLALITKSQTQRDILALNDLTQTVRAHLDHPESLDSVPLDTALLVFSKEGFLIYASPDAPDSVRTRSDALAFGWLCLPVPDTSGITAAIPDPASAALTKYRRILIFSAAALFAVLLLLAAAVGLWMQRRIITPFRNMRRFAENIAQGNLDEPLMSEQNNLFGTFTESFDIMREELRTARQREAAVKQREKEMIAALSHDIKTPVTGIKLICELLCVRTEDAYLKGKIESINAKAEQINLLAGDLLSTSLDTLGELNVSCQDLPSAALAELVREHDTRNLVQAGAIPECLIHADRNRLSQVIGNIISNSYKYANTPIQIQYAYEEHFLSMAISDQGSGIPEAEIGKITQKYYRGKNAAGKEGSGLGLYISGVLMQKMQGELLCTAASDDPESESPGLTVTLLIPLS